MKTIKLKESDIKRIVKKVIKEESLTDFPESIPMPVRKGFLLYKDGWIFNNRSVHKPWMWPAMKKLKDTTQEEIMELGFFLDDDVQYAKRGSFNFENSGEQALAEYDRLTQHQEYNPESKSEGKGSAGFVSELLDVLSSDGEFHPDNREQFFSYKNARGTHVIFLTKSNGKSESLKKQYLSQYNDLGGFKKIPVMYGPNGLEQIKS